MKAKRPVAQPGRNRRRRSTKRLRGKGAKASSPKYDAVNLRLLHELQVHQVELEMQNEELRLARAQTETLLSGKLHEERIRVEALLAEYTDLYDYAPTGYLTIDHKGKIVQLNFAGARLLGGERARLLKRRLGAFISPGDRKTFNDFVTRVFAGQTTARCEVSLGRKAALSAAVLIEGICHLSRQECRMVMFDVSEHKRSEQTRDQLAKIVETCSDAMISATLDGTVTSWNAAAERLCGFAAREIVGRSIAAIAPPGRQKEQRGIFERIRQGASVNVYETVRMRKDGRTFAAEMTVFPVKDATGRIVGASNIMRDITARKALERELVEITERERRDLGRELHDGLGQHLQGLHFLATLFQKDLTREKSPNAAAAGRLSTLLREATVLTREVAHGLQPVRPVPEGLMTALHKLAARTQTLFRIGCRLDCRTPVLVDNASLATHLYRIAQEAVTNAVTHAQPKTIVLALSSTSRRIVLAITDDGSGLRASRGGGDGIGLHIMQHRANAMGGDLTIRPSPAGGTEVVCSIPAKASGDSKSISNQMKS